MNAKQQYKIAYWMARSFKPQESAYNWYFSSCAYQQINILIAVAAWQSYISYHATGEYARTIFVARQLRKN